MTRIGHAAPYFMPLFCSSRPSTVVLTVFLSIFLFVIMLLTAGFLASEYPDTSVFQPDPQDYFRAAILGLFSPFLYFFIEWVLIGLKDRYLIWNLLFSFPINDWFLFSILIALAYPQLQDSTSPNLLHIFFNLYYSSANYINDNSTQGIQSDNGGKDIVPIWHIIPKQSYIFGISWSLGEFIIVVLSNLSSYEAVQQPVLDELNIPLSSLMEDNTVSDQTNERKGGGKRKDHHRYVGTNDSRNSNDNTKNNNGYQNTGTTTTKRVEAGPLTSRGISIDTSGADSTSNSDSNSILISFPDNPLGTPIDRNAITLSRCVDLRRATSSISSNVYSTEQEQRGYGSLDLAYRREQADSKETSGRRSGLRSGPGSGAASVPNPSSRSSTNPNTRGTLQRTGSAAASELDSFVLVMNPNDYSLRLTSAGLDAKSEGLGGGTPFLLRRYGYVWIYNVGTTSTSSDSGDNGNSSRGHSSGEPKALQDEDRDKSKNFNGTGSTVSTIGQGGGGMQGDIQNSMSRNATLVQAMSRTSSMRRFVEITAGRALTLKVLRMCLIVVSNTMLITGEALILSMYFTYVPGHDDLFTRLVVYFGSRTIRFFIWCVVVPFIFFNTLVAAAIYLYSELSDFYIEHNDNPSSLMYLNDLYKILYFYRHRKLSPTYREYNNGTGLAEGSPLYSDLPAGQLPSLLLRSPMNAYFDENFTYDLEWDTRNESRRRHTRMRRLKRIFSGAFRRWTKIATTNTYILTTMLLWSSFVFIVGVTSEIIY